MVHAMDLGWLPHQPDTWKFRLATLKQDTKMSQYMGRWENGYAVTEDTIAPAGTVVKIVMVSRFGDVGITTDLTAEHGYRARVKLDTLDELK
jgi:hypothetical protein